VISLAEMMACDDRGKTRSNSPEMLSFFRTANGPRERFASTSSHATGKLAAEAKFQFFVGVGQK